MWGQTTKEAVLAWSYQLTVVTAEMPVVPPGVDPLLLEVLLSPFYPTGVRECSATRNSKSESPASPAILCIHFLRGLAPGLVNRFCFCFAAHWSQGHLFHSHLGREALGYNCANKVSFLSCQLHLSHEASSHMTCLPAQADQGKRNRCRIKI